MTKVSTLLYNRHFIALTDAPFLSLVMNDVDGGLIITQVTKFYKV